MYLVTPALEDPLRLPWPRATKRLIKLAGNGYIVGLLSSFIKFIEGGGVLSETRYTKSRVFNHLLFLYKIFHSY